MGTETFEPTSLNRRAAESHGPAQAILQTVYAFFLGGVITAFIVIVLSTIYPSPETPDTSYNSSSYTAWELQHGEWQRNSGIVLLTLAVLLLASSLILTSHAIAISNGLLLGGLFTMAIAIGLIISSDNDVATLFALAIALAVTVTLGYLRFTRGARAKSAAQAAVATADTYQMERSNAPLAALEDRLATVERCLLDIRRALGG